MKQASGGSDTMNTRSDDLTILSHDIEKEKLLWERIPFGFIACFV